MLARPRPEVEHVRPDARRARLARRAHDLRQLLRAGRRCPGRIGAIPTPALIPRVDELLHARAGAAAAARSPARSSARRPRRASGSRSDGDVGAPCGLCSTSRSRTIIGPRVMIAERVRRRAERFEAARASAGSGPRRAGTGRSPRRSRRSRAATTRRASSRASTSATLTLTRIDAPVAVVGGPVGAPLERADVAERAPVHAAHVRVQRPLERHALDAVERGPAGLLAILDPHHMRSIEHMFAWGRRPRSRCRCRCGPATCTAYLLRGDDGWTLVDTGARAARVSRSVWREPRAGRAVARIVVTHMHPDHVGGARSARPGTGAPVSRASWTTRSASTCGETTEWPTRIAEWFRRTASRRRSANELIEAGLGLRAVHPLRARPGAARARATSVDGWEVSRLPGHADGHLCLVRDGVLVAGDHLLAAITPAVGLYPDSRPDPLGDYLDSLERTIELGPRARATRPRRADRRPGARARAQLIEHHRERLDATAAALGARAAHGLRGLVSRSSARTSLRRAPLRGRGDALAPGAARAPRAAPRAARADGAVYLYSA